ERPAERPEPEQYVSATSGGAAAESGSHQSSRSFAVRGPAGTVQRAERGYVYLHLAQQVVSATGSSGTSGLTTPTGGSSDAGTNSAGVAAASVTAAAQAVVSPIAAALPAA